MTDSLLVDTVAGVGGLDRTKASEAARRFRLEMASTRGEFEEGYALLDLQFGAQGEMEREEVLSAWFDRGSLTAPDAPIQATYHMVLVRDEVGTIAGVRDCYVTVDRTAKRVVVLLSHSLVLPPFRRSGLASLLRGVAVALGRQALPGGEILLAAEMEMVRPEDRDSVVRLMAYGRAGFAAIPPTVLAYAQPDFRDLKALGIEGTPLPFVPVVRQVGEEESPTISRERAWAFLAHFQAAQGCHCDPGQMQVIRSHAEQVFRGAPDPIALLPLPRHTAEVAVLAPLLKSATFPSYPPAWRGPEPLGSAADDLRSLLQVWSQR